MSFSKVTQSRFILLAPFYLSDIKSGIERELNNKMMTYSQTLGGIILSFDRIHIISQIASIVDDIPWIELCIEVDFLVLTFASKQFIDGVITKLTPTSIDLLIFNTFNAHVDVSSLVKNKKILSQFSFKIGQKMVFEINEYRPFSSNKMGEIIGSLPIQANVGVFDGNGKFVSMLELSQNVPASATANGAKHEHKCRDDNQTKTKSTTTTTNVATSETPRKRRKSTDKKDKTDKKSKKEKKEKKDKKDKKEKKEKNKEKEKTKKRKNSESESAQHKQSKRRKLK